MLRRIIWLLVGFPVAAILVTLAIANRHAVRLALDPFNPQEPVISLSMPFYFYIFGALVLGVVLGGVATWLSQSGWRRTARTRAQEAMRWQAEAERLTRERDAQVAGGRNQLTLARRAG